MTEHEFETTITKSSKHMIRIPSYFWNVMGLQEGDKIKVKISKVEPK